MVAVAVAVLGIGFVTYRHYHHGERATCTGCGTPVPVLVAKKLIEKGTPGDVVRTTSDYKVRALAKRFVETGAIVDPAALAGTVALSDISPGQQLTTAVFGRSPSVGGFNLRALVIPSPEEIGGKISAGSHVDVLVVSNKSRKPRELYRNMLVLVASSTTVTLRTLSPTQAGKLIYLEGQKDRRLILRLHQ